MGVYDTYGSSQLKVGPCEMKVYKIGDKVWIEDGLYIGDSSFIVIARGIFMAEYDSATSKWGDKVHTDTILEPFHPMRKIKVTQK